MSHVSKGKMRLVTSLLVALFVGIATIPSIGVMFTTFTPQIAVAKVVQMASVALCVWGAIGIVRQASEGDGTAKAKIVAFVAYIVLYSVLLAMIWPGGWRWDDLIQLNRTVDSCSWPIWQNYLTTLFYMTCLITVPLPGFIVFVEAAVLSALAAETSVRLGELAGSRRIVCILTFLLGLLPPTLNMNLYPLRTAMHSYLLVLILTLIAEGYLRGMKWDWKGILPLSMMSAIVAEWKSEYVVMVLIVPLLLLIFGRRGNKVIPALVALVMTGALTFALGVYQKVGDSSEGEMSDYTMTVYVPSLPYFAHEATVAQDQETLDLMGEIYDVDVLSKAYDEGVLGEYVYWHEGDWPYITVPKESRDDGFYDTAKSTFVTCCLRYPMAMLESRWNQAAMGMDEQWSPNFTFDVFDKHDGDFATFEGYPLNQPISRWTRNLVTGYMEAKAYFRPLWVTYYLPAALALMLVVAVMVGIRRPLLSLIPLAIIGCNAITFLAAPSYYFMYYYSLYAGVMFWLPAAIVGLACGGRQGKKKGA